MEPITVVTGMSYADYTRFNRFHLRQKKIFWIYGAILALGAICLAAGAFLSASHPDHARTCFLAGGVFVFLGATNILIQRNNQKKFWKSLPDSAKEPQTYRFEENAFIVELSGPDGDALCTQYAYPDILQVFETPTDFYIYVSPSQAALLPKAALDPSKITQLRKFLQARIPRAQYRDLCRQTEQP